jgi:hypothetical protein
MTIIRDDESITYHLNESPPNYIKHLNNIWFSTTHNYGIDNGSYGH